MKKLLIITDMYPHEAKTASGTFVQMQAEHLANWYEVKVVATFFPAEHKVVASREQNYELVSIDWPVRVFFPLNALNYRRHALPAIRKVIREWEPDLIHVHDCRHLPELFCLSRALRKLPGRKFLSVHAVKTLPEMAETPLHAVFYRLALGSAYRGWDHVFCVNEGLRQRLGKYVPLSRSSNIGNAVTAIPDREVPRELVDWLHPGSFKIISVGRLVESKGFDLLIKAAAGLIRQGHDLQVMIVGEGREKAALARLVEQLGLSGSVRVTGALDNPLVRNLYGFFDTFALPSYRESFGVVYLEAMSAGIPIVGVKGQGIDGIVEDGSTGVLTPPQSLPELEKALLWLRQHPEEAQEIARKGRELAQRDYGMDALIAKLRERYEA
ncbi:MAG: glycosyltransferase [Candidatus Syntrophosphaera sp.]|nr:glycosyltransferase [Candidatus Syntrophosphaera sp.]